MSNEGKKELLRQLYRTCRNHATSGESYQVMVPLIDEEYTSRWPTITLREVQAARATVEDMLTAEGLLLT